MMRRSWLFLSSSVLLLASAAVGSAQLPVEDGLLLWLDATDATTFDFDDDFINEWRDKSGNDYHAYPGDDSGVPTWTDDGINDLPSVVFEGANADGMIIDGLELERPYSAFIVNQYWGGTKGRTLQSQDANWLLGLWAGNVAHYAEGWVTDPRPSGETDVPYLVDTVGKEDSSTAFINGGNWTHNFNPTGMSGRLAISGAGMFPREVSDAYVSEIVIFDRALETDESITMRS